MELARKWLVVMAGACAFASTALSAPTLTTLYSFSGKDGFYPAAGLIADAQGNLYGTTEAGGPKYNAATRVNGDGTVFMYSTSSNKLTTLATLTSTTTGDMPQSRLALDGNGNLYGSTPYGGPGSDGTIFKVNIASKSIANVIAFNGANGNYPVVGLVRTPTGVYCAASFGGPANNGVLYRIDPTGNATTAFTFDRTSNCDGPFQTDLALAPDGRVAGIGGDMFEINTLTGDFTAIAQLNSSTPNLLSGPVWDSKGNIYISGESGIYKLDALSHTITTIATSSSTRENPSRR